MNNYIIGLIAALAGGYVRVGTATAPIQTNGFFSIAVGNASPQTLQVFPPESSRFSSLQIIVNLQPNGDGCTDVTPAIALALNGTYGTTIPVTTSAQVYLLAQATASLDPTGHAGDYLYTDGVNIFWNPPSGAPSESGEVVAGSGTSWTLANAPNPASSLQLFVQQYAGGPFALLKSGIGYTLSGDEITTTTSYGSGSLLAWYRF